MSDIFNLKKLKIKIKTLLNNMRSCGIINLPITIHFKGGTSMYMNFDKEKWLRNLEFKYDEKEIWQLMIEEFEKILNNKESQQILKLQIMGIHEYGDHSLKDESGTSYHMTLEFHDGIKPQVGDYIYVFKILLDPHFSDYCGLYAWGNYNSQYGSKPSSSLFTFDQMMKVVTRGKEIYLKRLYG